MLADGSISLTFARVSDWFERSPNGDFGWLSDEERARVDAMRSERRRRQFLSGHWLLRAMAAEYGGGEARQWEVSASPNGSPTLRHPLSGACLFASLSHSGEWLAGAVSPSLIGVDVESQEKTRDLLALAEQVFCPDECAELLASSDSARSSLFYRYWTLREAFGKRDGQGLRPERSRLQRLRPTASNRASGYSWQFDNVSLALAGVGAIAGLQMSGIPDGAHFGAWELGPA